MILRLVAVLAVAAGAVLVRDRRFALVVGLVNTAAIAVALMVHRTSSANTLATIAFCSFVVVAARAILDVVRRERSETLGGGGDLPELSERPVPNAAPSDEDAPAPGE